MSESLPDNIRLRYMTVSEACFALQVSRWTVKRLRDRGQLQWRKWVGGRVLVSRESVKQLIEA